MRIGKEAKENNPPHREHELSAKPAGKSMVSRCSNKQSKATVTGLVRVHSCMSPPHLRRNSKGMPSATATYTALRKVAAGGSLIPSSCRTAETSSQQHLPRSIEREEGAMQDVCNRGSETFVPEVSSRFEQQCLETSEAGNASQNCVSSESQHSIGNAELQQLCEAAMQDSYSAECWFGQAGTQQAPEPPAASATQERNPFSRCALPSTVIANEAQSQESRTQSGQRQQVTVAGKQIQTRANLERASRPRSNSQTGTLQPSLSMRSMRPMLGETTLTMLELSKIIKHLQAQLDHQEAVGASLEGQLGTALAELERLQALEASQQEAIEQAHLAGVQLGRQELQRLRLLNHKLEKALHDRSAQQQAVADKEHAAAVQTAAHVASLQEHIQRLKLQNEVTLKSKLRADHRNADLQRRHDTLKEQAHQTQRALESSQEEMLSLEDRLHMLRRTNSQLEHSESIAQLRAATAQQQVRTIDEERRLLLSFMQDQTGLSMSDLPRAAPEAAGVSLCTRAPEVAAATLSPHGQWPAGPPSSLQGSVSDSTALPGSLWERFSLNSPVRHASLPGRLKPSCLQDDSGQTASSSRAMCGADVVPDVAEQAEADVGTLSRGRADDPCRVQNASSLSKANPHRQDASVPVATSNGWHLRASSPVTRRKNNMHAEQQVYWHKKEALCPTIKNCIQEVQQLRAQLSADSADLNSEAAG